MENNLEKEIEKAKQHWLQNLSEEFESNSDDSYIGIIEVVNKVLKSDMAKEYHTKGMYSEEELLSFCKSAHEIGAGWGDMNVSEEAKEVFEEWFENNKK